MMNRGAFFGNWVWAWRRAERPGPEATLRPRGRIGKGNSE